MANKKISELTAKGATIASNDLIEISEYVSPGVYTSKSVTGAELGVLDTFLELTDTPNTFTGNSLKVARVNAGETALEFATVSAGVTTFTGLSDVPNSYVGQGGKKVKVNAGATGLEFVTDTTGLTNFTESQSTTAPNNTTYTNQLLATGLTSDVDIAITPKGWGALLAEVPNSATSQGNKRGANAVDFQMNRTAANQVASGNYSGILFGQNNKASGIASMAGGENCDASAQDAIALGSYCTASGLNSIALGTSTNATGISSFATGNTTYAQSAYSDASGKESNTFTVNGRKVHACGKFATEGDAQTSRLVVKNSTTNATVTTLYSDSNGATPTAQKLLTLGNNQVMRVKGSVVAKQTGTTNVAVFDFDTVIVRGAGAGTTTLAVDNVTTVVDTITVGGVDVVADTSDGALRIDVTGKAATNIRWVANIESTELIYA